MRPIPMRRRPRGRPPAGAAAALALAPLLALATALLLLPHGASAEEANEQLQQPQQPVNNDDNPPILLLRGADAADALDAAFAAASRTSADGGDATAAAAPLPPLLRGASPGDVASWRAVLLRDADAAFHPPSGGVAYTCRGLAAEGDAASAHGHSHAPHPTAATPRAGGGTSGALAPRDADPAPGDAFRLHSRPGAPFTIVLDFTGHRVSPGTAWGTNPATNTGPSSPAYDTDGDPSSFSEAERRAVASVWRAVSEDYSAFDVDVTTEEPLGGVHGPQGGDAPLSGGKGVRVCVGGDGAWLSLPPPARVGGVGLIRSFGEAACGPAVFVFSDNLGRGDPTAVAEAAAHEAGHALGLFHDGLVAAASSSVAVVGSQAGAEAEASLAPSPSAAASSTPSTSALSSPAAQEYYQGAGVWSPIMGRSYGAPVTQFDRGEYPRASNPGQDDLAAIARFLPLLGDEGGGGATGATGAAGPGPVLLRAADVAQPSGVVLPGVLRTGGPRYWRFSLPAAAAAASQSPPSPARNDTLTLTLDVQPPVRSSPAFGAMMIGRADLAARVRVLLLQQPSSSSSSSSSFLAGATELLSFTNAEALRAGEARAKATATIPLSLSGGSGSSSTTTTATTTRDVVIEIFPSGGAGGAFGPYGSRGAFQLELRGAFAASSSPQPSPPLDPLDPPPLPPLDPLPPPVLECPDAPVVLPAASPGTPECADGSFVPRKSLYRLIDGASGAPYEPSLQAASAAGGGRGGAMWSSPLAFAVVVAPDPSAARLLPGTERAFSVRLVRADSQAGAGAPVAECAVVARAPPCAADTVVCAGGGGSGGGSAAALSLPSAPPAARVVLLAPQSPNNNNPQGPPQASPCRGTSNLLEAMLYSTASGLPAQSISPPLPPLLGPGRHRFVVVARGGLSSCTATVEVVPCRPACRAGAAVDASPGACDAAAPLLPSAVVSDETLGEGALGASPVGGGGGGGGAGGGSSSAAVGVSGKKAVRLVVLYPGGLLSQPTARACKVQVRDAQPPALLPVDDGSSSGSSSGGGGGSSSNALPPPAAVRLCAYPRRAGAARACVPASAAFSARDNCPAPGGGGGGGGSGGNRASSGLLRVAGCLPADAASAAGATPATSVGFCSASKKEVCVELAGMGVGKDEWRDARGLVRAADAAGNVAAASSQLLVRAYASAAAAASAGEASCLVG